jgi:tRNA(Ile)-lysidine synthase TilS/MesJ
MEREYLEWHCNKLNIHLYYRTIHYLKREEQRELFETESRRARFELYKYVVDLERLEGVCLGHHKGDVVENVLTNLIRGRDPSDMTVMREQQLMDGVQLFRPLLSLTKDDIYDYAHSYGIRYFLNSTPAWSCRGVLRDTVLPALKNQFGEFESNVIAFAEKCSFYANEYEALIDQQRQPLSNAYGTRVVHTGKDWNALVMNIMHGYGYPMASKKSMTLMLHWLDGKRNAMFQLSKDVVVCAQDKYLYFINHTLVKKDKLVSFELFPELCSSLLKRLL